MDDTRWVVLGGPHSLARGLRHPAVHLLTVAFLAGAAVFALPLFN
ncbi:hypothetical protein [Arenimonas fontis]|nr:hypothetical protein [Arenimonas fontis]